MKSTLFLVAFTSLLGCTPRGGTDYYPGYTVAINAQVLNPKSEIILGDSVAFSFEVPDTVDVNGSKIKVAATGSKDGGSLGFFTNKINPAITGGAEINPSSCQWHVNPGEISPTRTLIFANHNGKLKATFYMIPRQKGVYFFVQTQEGYAWLNDKGLSTRLSINFGNVNRNHQMLIDSAGTASGFDKWLQDRVSRGMEVYGFRVK